MTNAVRNIFLNTIDLETSSYESTYDADVTLINNQSNRPSTDGVTTPSLNLNQTDEGRLR